VKPHIESELKPDSHRVEAFSDGVFAIVVTIMVLEIRIPDSLAFGTDPAALKHFATYLGTYALSFLVIVNLWTSHHYLLFTVRNPARTTLWYNSLLLFTVSLVPIATRFLGMHPMSSRAAAGYGLVAAACTAAFMLLRSHAARTTQNEVHRGIHRRVIRRTWVFLTIYLASIAGVALLATLADRHGAPMALAAKLPSRLFFLRAPWAPGLRLVGGQAHPGRF